MRRPRRSAASFGRTRTAPLAVALALATSLLPASARSALERVAPGGATVFDVNGRARGLPDPRRPVLIVYDDRKSEGLNRHLEPLLRQVAGGGNRDRVELLAIADVEEWDFWPARRFVLEHLRHAMERDQWPIYCDWRGAVRRGLGLVSGRGAVVLLLPDGEVRFAAQGRLGPAEQAELTARLVAIGVRLSSP